MTGEKYAEGLSTAPKRTGDDVGVDSVGNAAECGAFRLLRDSPTGNLEAAELLDIFPWSNQIDIRHLRAPTYHRAAARCP